MIHANKRIELPYPPPEKDELVKAMHAKINALVPTGQKLSRMIDHENRGPDIGDDFHPCWTMYVSFETVDIEPQVWEGSD